MNIKWSMRGLLVLGVAMMGGPGLLADTSDEAIAERLAPVGSVCLQGQDCGTAASKHRLKQTPRAAAVKRMVPRFTPAPAVRRATIAVRQARPR